MINITVWEYNNMYWHQVLTEDYFETKDEYKYFRVIRNGRKEFYKSAEDYKIHQFIKNFVTVNNKKY